MRSFDGQTPDINYPCVWALKVVGRSSETIEAAVQLIVDREYSLNASKVSRGGKYVSLELTVTVTSDEDRREIGQRLHNEPNILFVF